ncbi:MAG: hypothetical protein AAF829_13390 [Pseudomonadota bacterium]
MLQRKLGLRSACILGTALVLALTNDGLAQETPASQEGAQADFARSVIDACWNLGPNPNDAIGSLLDDGWYAVVGAEEVLAAHTVSDGWLLLESNPRSSSDLQQLAILGREGASRYIERRGTGRFADLMEQQNPILSYRWPHLDHAFLQLDIYVYEGNWAGFSCEAGLLDTSAGRWFVDGNWSMAGGVRHHTHSFLEGFVIGARAEALLRDEGEESVPYEAGNFFAAVMPHDVAEIVLPEDYLANVFLYLRPPEYPQ